MTISFSIDLSRHVICYRIGRKRRFVPVLVLYLIHSCIQDWVILGSDDWHPILFHQTICHFSKVRPISISWHCRLHVQIRVVKHIWREIVVSLQHMQVFDDVIKLLLKLRVVFRVLRPVFRIWLQSFISKVFFLFEATTYICVGLINTGLEFLCLLLYNSDVLECSYLDRRSLLDQYSI